MHRRYRSTRFPQSLGSPRSRLVRRLSKKPRHSHPLYGKPFWNRYVTIIPIPIPIPIILLAVAVGQVLPAVMVTASGGMPGFLLTTMLLSAVTFLLCLVLFPSHPPTPPSTLAALRSQRRISNDSNFFQLDHHLHLHLPPHLHPHLHFTIPIPTYLNTRLCTHRLML